MTAAVTPTSAGPRSWRWVLVPLAAGALISLTAGLLAHHDPRSKGYFRLFFSDPLHLKAGFATAAVVLACFQLFTAAWIFRKLPWPKPPWVNPVHRWSGRLAASRIRTPACSRTRSSAAPCTARSPRR
jgi:hypothetical protein